MLHTGLRTIDVTRLDEFTTTCNNTRATGLDDDPFADLVVEPPPVPEKRGRKQKLREAGDGKGPLEKVQKPKVCSVCDEPGHNKKCKMLIRLEGESARLGII
jgi:hypothetical protein